MKLLPLRLSSPASKKNRKHLKGGGGGMLGKGIEALDSSFASQALGLWESLLLRHHKFESG
jgi:hypothetical protein